MIATIAGVSLGACAHHETELRHPMGASTRAQLTSAEGSTGMSVAESQRDVPSGVAVVVSPAVLRACGIAEPPALQGFPFDSADVRPTGETLLARIAACAAEGGPLSQARIRVSGYADPRGARDYNQSLGLYRAIAARNQLVAAGLAETRIDVASLGESEARGTDESTRQLDRRIQIDLITEPSPSLREKEKKTP